MNHGKTARDCIEFSTSASNITVVGKLLQYTFQKFLNALEQIR